MGHVSDFKKMEATHELEVAREKFRVSLLGVIDVELRKRGLTGLDKIKVCYSVGKVNRKIDLLSLSLELDIHLSDVHNYQRFEVALAKAQRLGLTPDVSV